MTDPLKLASWAERPDGRFDPAPCELRVIAAALRVSAAAVSVKAIGRVRARMDRLWSEHPTPERWKRAEKFQHASIEAQRVFDAALADFRRAVDKEGL